MITSGAACMLTRYGYTSDFCTAFLLTICGTYLQTNTDHRTFLPLPHLLPTPQAYSNRAASYIKLGALPEAKKDAEKCIEIDKTFIKGYLRKGAAEFFMKEHDKAMKTYQEGLKLDPGNHELQEGIRR